MSLLRPLCAQERCCDGTGLVAEEGNCNATVYKDTLYNWCGEEPHTGVTVRCTQTFARIVFCVTIHINAPGRKALIFTPTLVLATSHPPSDSSLQLTKQRDALRENSYLPSSTYNTSSHRMAIGTLIDRRVKQLGLLTTSSGFELACFCYTTLIWVNFDLWIHKPQCCESVESKTSVCLLVIIKKMHQPLFTKQRSRQTFLIHVFLSTNMVNFWGFFPFCVPARIFLLAMLALLLMSCLVGKRGQSWAALFQPGLRLIFRPVTWRH